MLWCCWSKPHFQPKSPLIPKYGRKGAPGPARMPGRTKAKRRDEKLGAGFNSRIRRAASKNGRGNVWRDGAFADFPPEQSGGRGITWSILELGPAALHSQSDCPHAAL